MADSNTKQVTPFIKKKQGVNFGFKVPEFVRTSKFGGKKPILNLKYGPSSVRTQHKGGGGK